MRISSPAALTLDQFHDVEKSPDQPQVFILRVFLFERDQRFRVVFEFLVTMRTGVGIEEIAELNTTMRTD